MENNPADKNFPTGKKVLIAMLQLHKSSGSARTAYENMRYFKSHGFEVHVAAMTMDKELLQSMGVITHKMLPWIKSTGFTRRRWYNWQVQRLRKKLSPDITVGHGDISDQDVLTLHNCVFLASELIHNKLLPKDHEMALTHNPLLREMGFSKMIANSELMKKDTVERFHVPPEIIHVVYPALDTKIFRPLPKKSELRTRFGFPDKVIVSLVTSGNFQKRGLDLFISAIEQLSADIRDKASFRVVGKDEKGQYSGRGIIFDPGLSDIESYFNAIDIFVLPARIEEFGRVVLEAMGCGVPVITTDKVGAGELLEADAREFVIPSQNVTALSEALTKLITDPALRKKLGELNVRLAQQQAEETLGQRFDRVFLENKK
jgi:UDP-glucose:(heptosyl)LPS alpha-1,3-glucosyltransferase